jgi:lysophospholipase L1-like esterase
VTARLLAAVVLTTSTAAAQTISGVVRDAECKPIPGATVTLRSRISTREVISRTGGRFTVEDLNEPRYEASIGTAGFYGFRGEITPAEASASALTVVLPVDELELTKVVESGLLELRWSTRREILVQDYDCRPIPGATVTLGGRKAWTATADANGIVKLPGGPSGIYTITASAQGHTSATLHSVRMPFKYRVPFGPEGTLVISLRRGPPEPADSFVKWDPTVTSLLQHIRIVAMGDSTTAGTPAFKSPREAPPNGSGDAKSQYAYYLRQAHPDWEVVNQGVNAERSDVIAARFDADVIAKKPHVVVIIAGVNDVYQGRPAQHVKEQLGAMYEKARAAGIKVVAGTIIPYNTATADQNARMHEINAWIRAQADAGLVTFVDTRAAVAAPGQPDRLAGSPDGLHPDVAGYRRMAEALEPAIVKAILLQR